MTPADDHDVVDPTTVVVQLNLRVSLAHQRRFEALVAHVNGTKKATKRAVVEQLIDDGYQRYVTKEQHWKK